MIDVLLCTNGFLHAGHSRPTSQPDSASKQAAMPAPHFLESAGCSQVPTCTCTCMYMYMITYR